MKRKESGAGSEAQFLGLPHDLADPRGPSRVPRSAGARRRAAVGRRAVSASTGRTSSGCRTRRSGSSSASRGASTPASRRTASPPPRRGGYCFHLNGALSELLASLGYDVVRHVGGVHGPDGAVRGRDDQPSRPDGQRPPDRREPERHLVRRRRARRCAARAAAADRRRRTTRGRSISCSRRHPVTDAVGDWHLTHDPKGAFTGMAWRSAPAAIDVFAPRHGGCRPRPSRDS